MNTPKKTNECCTELVDPDRPDVQELGQNYSNIPNSGLLSRYTQEIDSFLRDEIFSTFEIVVGVVRSNNRDNRKALWERLRDYWNGECDIIDLLFDATINHPVEECRHRAIIALSELKTLAKLLFPDILSDVLSEIEYQVHRLKRISSQIQDENTQCRINELIKQIVDLDLIFQRELEIHPDIRNILVNEDEFPIDSISLEDESQEISALGQRLEEIITNPKINLIEDLLSELSGTSSFSKRAFHCLKWALAFDDPILRRIAHTQLSNWTDKLLSTESNKPIESMLREVILPSSPEKCKKALGGLLEASSSDIEGLRYIINHILFERACLCLREGKSAHNFEQTQCFLENTLLSGIMFPQVIDLLLERFGTNEFLPSSSDFYNKLGKPFPLKSSQIQEKS